VSGIDVSIIIPTFNRCPSLLETLKSLEDQSLPADRFEVIVVDDGSTDSTTQVAAKAFPYPFRYIRQENQGSAEARNRGAIESRGRLLVFIDDDIYLEPEYVEGLWEEHIFHEDIVGMGTSYTLSKEPGTLFTRTYSAVVNSSTQYRQSAFVLFTECQTNNLSVLRDDFFQIGMMQDIAGDGPTWWGDIDFGYRAHKLGFRFCRSGKAVCRHYDYSIQDFKTFCRRNLVAAQIAVLLFKKYPEVQMHLPMFDDKTPISLQSDPLPLVAQKLWHSINSVRLFQASMERLVSLMERILPYPALLWPMYRWIMSSYIYQGYRRGLQKFGPVEEQR
jgi:glycosyltransferase involved in cell wall biosynthesis